MLYMIQKPVFPVLFFLALSFQVLVLTGCGQAPQKTGLEKEAFDLLKKMGGSAIELNHAIARVHDIQRTDTISRMKKAVAILDPYIRIKGMLNTFQYRKRETLGKYLGAYKKWLAYSAKHYSDIRGGNLQNRRTYDRYLADVNRSREAFNAASHKYHKSARGFLKANPALLAAFQPEFKVFKKELDWL